MRRAHRGWRRKQLRRSRSNWLPSLPSLALATRRKSGARRSAQQGGRPSWGQIQRRGRSEGHLRTDRYRVPYAYVDEDGSSGWEVLFKSPDTQARNVYVTVSCVPVSGQPTVEINNNEINNN